MFNHLLEKAMDDITPELALKILEESRDPAKALELFRAASRLRDEHLGKDLLWTAGVARILPCKIKPRCRYCTFFSDEEIGKKVILEAVKEIEKLGFRNMHLSGGTDFDGYGDEILGLVKAIKESMDMDIAVNLGPSLSANTVIELKKSGVVSITSSLETFSEKVFAAAKPGDSLEKRKELMEICEREGVSIRSMMLVGLGETYEDRVRQLFYLKRFSHLTHLHFSRFNPHPGTLYKDHPRCSPWEVARIVAVARLVLPKVNLGMAAGNTPDDIPLWHLAGGGNMLLGAHISLDGATGYAGEGFVNNMTLIKRYVEGMNRNILFVQKSYL